MPYPPQGSIDQLGREEIARLKRDAKCWKIISIVLFFVGIGAGWLLSKLF